MKFRLPRTGLQFAVVAIVLVFSIFVLRAMLNDGHEPLMQPVASIDHTHLHGAALDAQLGRILLATHHGLFALEAGQLYQMGKRRDDFMGFTASAQDSNVIYVSGHPPSGGNLGVLKTTDGGQTFTQVFSGLEGGPVDFHAMAASPLDANLVYGFFRGQLYRTEAGAEDWVVTAANHMPTQGFCWGAPCLTTSATERARIYAGTPFGLWVSDDMGAQWSPASTESIPVAGVGSSPHRAGLLFAHTGTQGVAVSSNGGHSWEPRNTGIELGENEIVFGFMFHPDQAERIFLATTGNQIYTSNNLGKIWEKLL